ncbi:glutathione hydrolase-like YwrD proenzyme [Argiope bruennichi]|uniref:glutathione hydrolase-like YwrD proenzyme n=1 Tax=Argiope bruennichi TaxID=94029 RepID=UPI00249491C0|nr:glutathione hydrolase-like YwrD proenzyme [Argiope bruennichi]XP_055953553.1 glutathione hydrolase-like YwrD proenzyme [Argiope bruennichi]
MDIFVQNSSIVSRNASVSSDQPAATQIGIDILKRGGNAADAAVATMAAVTVIEPLSCGIGGDCHCTFYRKKDKKVMSVNGSGRTGKNATMDKIRTAGIKDPMDRDCFNHGLWVSVPGTIAGMVKVIEEFGSGKLTMKDIFGPAIRLAEEGVPIPFKHATMWETCQEVFRPSKNANDLLIEGKAPAPGDIIYAPKLAKVLRNVAEAGVESFYGGTTAQNIAAAVQEAGGALTAEDMKEHVLNPPNPSPYEPLSVDFNGVTIWEMKPNTMGIVALVAFNILKAYDLKALGHNSPDYIHLVAEATKHAYLEAWEYLCDPKCCSKRVEDIITEEYAQKLRNKIDPERAYKCHQQFVGSDTSYVAAVDEEGNGCSFICSVSSNFGTGIIPDDCGFVLHDRAKSMSLEEDSTNVFGPNKLPLHSIIPAIVTETATNDLLAVIGVVGRWMQPQGHLQVLLNMILFGMDPQVALNQPRFFVGDPRPYVAYKGSLQGICLEGGIDPSVVPFLESKGHNCRFFAGYKREVFGKGHVIARSKLFNPNSAERSSKSWWSGADPRCDGCPMGY